MSNLENNTIDCGLTCTDGTIVITDLEVNNTIFARIGGALVNLNEYISNITSVLFVQQEKIDFLLEEVNTQASEIANMTGSRFRMEVNSFAPILSVLPDTEIVSFPSTGFYGFYDDPLGIFELAANYTTILKNSAVSIVVNVYFSASVEESVLLCFVMANETLVPGTYPTIISGGGEAFNTTAFMFTNYSGVVTSSGMYAATAGDRITIRCGVSEGDADFIFLTSQVSMTGYLR
ncbi:MAG: hypothetical protein JSS82_00100 [Bacteroidetes bacterium]|nr:hypothetical protein [Bacteroidota bacterium]